MDHLIQVVKYLNYNNFIFDLIGNTSNTYFKNEYNPDIVLSTKSLTEYRDKEDILVCECGCIMKNLSRYAVSKGYEGYEGFIDLPGTVASAIYNNSGCFGYFVSSLLIKVDYLNNENEGEIIQLYPEDMSYEIRSSILKRNSMDFLGGVILKVYFKKPVSENISKILKSAEKYHEFRLIHQSSSKMNLGSIHVITSLKFSPKLFIYGSIALQRIFSFERLYLQKIQRNILVYLFGGYKIKKYICKLNYNRFIWCDSNADEAFIKYQKFINKIAKKAKLEIEIKQ